MGLDVGLEDLNGSRCSEEAWGLGGSRIDDFRILHGLGYQNNGNSHKGKHVLKILHLSKR